MRWAALAATVWVCDRASPLGLAAGDTQIDAIRSMASRTIIERAHHDSGLSQRAFAQRSGTSQPALPSYESGSRSPTLTVVGRVVQTSDLDLDLTPRVLLTTHSGTRDAPYLAPDRL